MYAQRSVEVCKKKNFAGVLLLSVIGLRELESKARQACASNAARTDMQHEKKCAWRALH